MTIQSADSPTHCVHCGATFKDGEAMALSYEGECHEVCPSTDQRFTALRAKGVLDADDNLDCWDTPPFEFIDSHVKRLNEKDPAAMWRVAQLYVESRVRALAPTRETAPALSEERTEDGTLKTIADGFRLHGYVQGSKECVAFHRGIEYALTSAADREQRPAALSEAMAALIPPGVDPHRPINWIHPVVHETLQREADRLNNELASLKADRERAITGEPVGWFQNDAADGQPPHYSQIAVEFIGTEDTFPLYRVVIDATLEMLKARAALSVPSEGIASVAASEPTREERAQWSKDFSNWAFYDEDLPRAIGLMDGSEAAHHAWFAAAKKYRAALVAASDGSDQLLGLLSIQADEIRKVLDELAPETVGNLQTRLRDALVAASDESLSRQSSEAAESPRSTRNTPGSGQDEFDAWRQS